MGMFDSINFKMKCPGCGITLDTFQSKDGPCALSTLEYWEVSNFYDFCNKCDTWVEFTRHSDKPTRHVEMDEDARMVLLRFTHDMKVEKGHRI